MNLKRALEEFKLFAQGYPPVANLSVNTVCNQRCLICQRWRMHWQKEQDKLTLEEMKDLVYQLVKELHVKRFRITSTEPLLRGDLPEIVRYIRQFTGCNLITNGMAMTPQIARELIKAGISEVRFSIDSPNEINDELRGVKGAWERSKNGIRILKEAKRELGTRFPLIDIYAVLTKMNIEFIPDMYRFVADEKLDGLAYGIVWEDTPQAVSKSIFKGRQIARTHMIPQKGSLKPTSGQVLWLRRELVRMGLVAGRKEGTMRFIESLIGAIEGRSSLFRCPYHYFVNIDPVGNFIACTETGEYSFGNIRTKKAKDIWFGRDHFDFVSRVGRDPFPVCREICDAKDELYIASLKSEIRGLAMSMLYPLNLSALYRQSRKR